MNSYTSIKEVVELLNKEHVKYVILRNYQNLLDDLIYEGGHEDIDFLVENTSEVVGLLNAIPNKNKEDGTHYHIFVKGNRVNLDLRHIGDGYYCEEWQKNMINTRVVHNGFFVMNNENYYYSLCYHAILQKKNLSSEYLLRLNEMAKGLSLPDDYFGNESNLLKGLLSYMKTNGYRFSYTEDPSIPLRFSLVNYGMVKFDVDRFLKHQVFLMSQNMLKIKRIIRKLVKK